MGIKGVVLNADGTPAENADIVVWNPDGTRYKMSLCSEHYKWPTNYNCSMCNQVQHINPLRVRDVNNPISDYFLSFSKIKCHKKIPWILFSDSLRYRPRAERVNGSFFHFVFNYQMVRDNKESGVKPTHWNIFVNIPGLIQITLNLLLLTQCHILENRSFRRKNRFVTAMI